MMCKVADLLLVLGVQTIEEWYRQACSLPLSKQQHHSHLDSAVLFVQLPIITKTYVTLAFLTTAACALEV